LLDNGRSLVEQQVGRGVKHRLIRDAVLNVLPYPKRIAPLVKLGQWVKAILPASLGASVPLKQKPGQWPATEQQRTMLVLDGCVQPSMAPATNAAAARVLNALGVQLINAPAAGCCGAVHFHLNKQTDAKDFMRRNIDAWWPYIEAGAESVITTASGCGVMVKDYGHVLQDDDQYAQKAARISSLCKDIVEVLQHEDLSRFKARASELGSIAFHPPCTLQHGQKLPMATENLLSTLGFKLVPVADAHTCCGSAGTYSLFQPELSRQLKENKVAALTTNQPDIIATANIGCQLQLQSGTGKAVVHWVELLDQILD